MPGADCAPMPRVITVAEAAKRLNVHDRTVRRWIREGRLKPYRLMGDPKRYVDRKSTRLNSSHSQISYAVFCLKKKNTCTRSPRAIGPPRVVARKMRVTEATGLPNV